MDEIVYRKLVKKDYPFVEDLIDKSFGLYQYVPDETALAQFKHTYLQTCLAEQTYCRVAEKNGKVVGVIMGKANADYRLTAHILPIASGIWRTLCMKFMARRCGCSTSDYEHLHKVYREFLSGRSDKYDGILTLFAVDETCRGMGLGRKLLQELEEYFQAKGVSRIYLYTDSTCNTGFYDSHGFSGIDERTIQVTRDGRKTDLNVFFYEKSYTRKGVD